MSGDIFEAHPLSEELVLTSFGPQPHPYHVYDGRALLIGGSADLDAVTRLLAPEQVTPIRREDGRALMGVWLTEHEEASHGSHRELQIAIYASRRPLPPQPAEPFALLRVLLQEPDARQLCHGLWNDDEAVVAYNREQLHLPARLGRIELRDEAGRLALHVEDAADGQPLLRGSVPAPARPSWGAIRALLDTFGIRGAIDAAFTRVIPLRVLNPVGESLPRNEDAQTYSRSERIGAALLDPKTDTLELLAPPYANLDFRPDFVELLLGFQMVYLSPGDTARLDGDVGEG